MFLFFNITEDILPMVLIVPVEKTKQQCLFPEIMTWLLKTIHRPAVGSIMYALLSVRIPVQIEKCIYFWKRG